MNNIGVDLTLEFDWHEPLVMWLLAHSADWPWLATWCSPKDTKHVSLETLFDSTTFFMTQTYKIPKKKRSSLWTTNSGTIFSRISAQRDKRKKTANKNFSCCATKVFSSPSLFCFRDFLKFSSRDVSSSRNLLGNLARSTRWVPT